MNKNKQETLEAFQLFLNKYESVCKKAFLFNNVLLFPAEIHTLDFIRKKEKTFVSEIAKETGITRGAASQVTVKLKKKGLIKSFPDHKNKSRFLLEVTEKGEQACIGHEKHHNEKDKIFHEFFDSMDKSKLENVKDLFVRLNEWMNNYL